MQNASKITKNNSRAIIFVIISCQRVCMQANVNAIGVCMGVSCAIGCYTWKTKSDRV